ncbi:MAG: OmpH family outer membrane protein [Bacteroidaceae bacterium]|nr:OmpH family outer membrane protein [Bacteroidaceae bacterium]MBQ5776986.1 OmpH family outer membrane protein [Bacteroidaceae bacterium]MBR5002334.1 OmpH family outer membrane protein [Bacteroidaceae bacterium]
MFKKLIIAILCCLPLTMVAQTLKFGTINTGEVLTAMPERAAAEQQLQDLTKRYEDEFVKLQEDFQKKYQEVQAMGDTVPETIKMRRYEELQAMDQRIQSFRQVVEQDLAKKQEELFIPIQQKLMDAINAVGSENGFTYIFDANAAYYKGVGNEDVTPLVKAKLGIQ